jgi:type IV secretory pathway VirB10-like protein
VRTVRMLAAIVFFAGLCVVCRTPAAQQDQSQSGSGDPVADAARKAREQKRTAPKPKKVFTEDDIAPKPAPEPPQPPASSAAAPEEASQATAAAQKDDTAKKEDPNSEAAWRKRFLAQRRKIADAEQELDVLQREAEKLDVQYYSDPQKALHEQYSRKEIGEKTDKIEAKKKEIAGLKQQFSDMEDELRRIGGDPGWAR